MAARTEGPDAGGPEGAPRFRERPAGLLCPEAAWAAGVPLVLAALAAAAGQGLAALALVGLGAFGAFFFRNPERAAAGDARTVVAPADGRVLAVGEVEEEGGAKRLRIGIFLSLLDVHVSRVPVAGRVRAVERGGEGYLAAFRPEAEARNVRCRLELETEADERVDVVQITGLVARRIVCHPRVGERVERGDRYGLIRFGSRTDVRLPAASRPLVAVGDRVRGGASALARLPEAP